MGKRQAGDSMPNCATGKWALALSCLAKTASDDNRKKKLILFFDTEDEVWEHLERSIRDSPTAETVTVTDGPHRMMRTMGRFGPEYRASDDRWAVDVYSVRRADGELRLMPDWMLVWDGAGRIMRTLSEIRRRLCEKSDFGTADMIRDLMRNMVWPQPATIDNQGTPLGEIVHPSGVGGWLRQENDMLDGLTPLQVLDELS